MAKDATNVLVYSGATSSTVTLSETQVALVLDASEGGKPSASGKTMLVAISHGAQPLTDDLTYSLNVMKKITLTAEEIAKVLANRPAVSK